MAVPNKNIDAHFFQLVASLQMATLQNLGKIASPVDNKTRKDFDQAQSSIDMLAMLAEKTDGNLSVEEKDLIDRTLYQLRMVFVEESKKNESESQKGEGD